jgi:thioredoxin-related protein
VVNRLRRSYGKKVKFRSVNCDLYSSSSLQRKYNIRSIPTFVFVNSRGKTTARIVGNPGEAALRSRLRKLK